MYGKRKDQPPPARPATSVETPPPVSQAPAPPRPSGGAVVGPALVLSGELSGEEDVIIAGQFQGKISLPGNSLLVTQGAQVDADVVADTVQVEGRLAGDVQGNSKVTIAASGQMEGTITAPRLVLVDGAKFKGSVVMDLHPEPKAGTSQPAGASPRPPAGPPGAQRGEARASGNSQPGVGGKPQ